MVTGNKFIYMPQAKITVNLMQITAVLWNKVEDPTVNPVYVTTIATIGGGDFFITAKDSELLAQELKIYNREQSHPIEALTKVSDALFWLCRFVSELNLNQEELTNSATQNIPTTPTTNTKSTNTSSVQASALSNATVATPATSRRHYSEIHN